MRRSMAGPVFLVLLGVLLLLANMGRISWTVFPAALRFWPLFLVVLGLSIIVSSRTGMGGSLVGWTFVALLALILIVSLAFPGSLNRGPWSAEMVDETFATTDEENRAASARVELDLGAARATIEGGAPGIFEAHAHYSRVRGPFELERRASAGELDLRYARRDGWTGVPFLFQPERHEIRLGSVPTELEIGIGSGDVNLRPEGTPLRGMEIRAGSGSVAAEFTSQNLMPGGTVRVNVGSGRCTLKGFGFLQAADMDVDVGSGTVVLQASTMPRPQTRIRVHVGSGRLRLELPAGVAYRVQGEIGSGSLRIGDERYNDRELDRGAVIQSPGFDAAGSRVEVIIDVGSGEAEILFI